MIDAMHLKAHYIAFSLREKRCLWAYRTRKGGLNSKLGTVVDQDGKPICLLLSEGEMSDYKGAALLSPVLPQAQELIADKGYGADWFRQALLDKNIKPCIPPRKG